MSQPPLDSQSRRNLGWTAAAIGALAILTAALAPVAGVSLSPLPGFSSLFAAAVFVAELSTSFLLLLRYWRAPTWSVLILVSAYFYSSLMTVAYVVTFPGALRESGALFGGPQSIAWIFLIWTTGYAGLTLAAVIVEAFFASAVREGRRAAAAAAAVVVVSLIVIAAVLATVSFAARLPSLIVNGGWTTADWLTSCAMPLALLCGAGLVLLVMRARSELFLWLSVAQSAVAFGNILSTIGGGRYTVGWYACRISWVVSACALFFYFVIQFGRQHGLLLRTTDDLQERTRERDRIWSVSEDLLGVSTFDGRLININPAWTALLGWSAAEICARPVSVLRHPDDATHSLAARAQLIAGAQTVRVENRFRHQDGSWRWIAWTMSADQGLIYVCGRHVTVEREAQDVLRKAAADRAHLQKMEALGQLTGGVAHDFNNLLMIISGHIGRIGRIAKDNEVLRGAVQAVETAAHRGQSLTRQLLGFSRRQPTNPTVVDIAAALPAARPMLLNSLNGPANLDLDVAADLWPSRIDPNEFELALINLAVNARDATSGEGAISIAARNVNLDAGDTADGLEGDFVAVTVADRGTGIPPDILPKIFDPFFTTKAPGKGSGLGLSQVHGFVHRSGGTVTVDSELGKGTSVTLYLPRSHAPAEAPSAAVPQPRLGGVTLLVEDNPDVAEVVKAMLESIGYAVYCAADAQQAFELFAQNRFDLLISDIVMAGALNGIELARKLQARAPDLPIVLMTGYAGPADAAAAEFVTLRKPFSEGRLAAVLSEVMAARGQRAASSPASRAVG